MTDIACGQHHLLFLTPNNKMYGLGSNKFGQLGKPIEHLSKTSHPISILDELSSAPTQVVCGWNFSGCLLENGSVYLWGRCDLGQLGYDPQSNQEPLLNSIKKGKICDSPVFNIYLKDIKTLVSGSESCFALDKDQNLFSFGWNEHGNCGCGHHYNLHRPTSIFQTDFVAAGYGYCLVYNRI